MRFHIMITLNLIQTNKLINLSFSYPKKGKTDTLLIGPGKNNTLGLRPGAVLVGNDKGQTVFTFIYDPETGDGKIVASVKQGKLSKGKAQGKLT